MARKLRGQRHVPQRTCIACRQAEGKRSLIRLVRTEQGIETDLTSKKSGRGAYIHPHKVCWETALSSNRIEQALRTTLSDENRRVLYAYMACLPESENVDSPMKVIEIDID